MLLWNEVWVKSNYEFLKGWKFDEEIGVGKRMFFFLYFFLIIIIKVKFFKFLESIIIFKLDFKIFNGF